MRAENARKFINSKTSNLPKQKLSLIDQTVSGGSGAPGGAAHARNGLRRRQRGNLISAVRAANAWEQWGAPEDQSHRGNDLFRVWRPSNLQFVISLRSIF